MSLRFILLMRHAKHTKGRIKEQPKPATPLTNIAGSLREIAHTSAMMRGARPDRSATPAGESPSGVLSDEGRSETQSVTKRMKEFLEEWSEKLTLSGVLVAESPEADETAIVFCQAYPRDPPRKVTTIPFLTPKLGSKTQELKKDDAKAFAELLMGEVCRKAHRLVDSANAENAVLVVGHQPFLGWLADALVGEAYPLAHSEILCLDLKKHLKPTLLWSLSPSDEATSQKLHEKIRSKMTLANLLSGFITAGIGVLLAMLGEKAKLAQLGVQGPMVFVAAGCLLLAVMLYLRTMFSYDSLLMPTRFWIETPAGTSHRPSWIVARPPSAAHWILYQNMLRVWQWQFMPATFLTLSGLFVLWSAVFWGTWGMSHDPKWIWTALSRVLVLSPPLVAFLIVLWPKRKKLACGIRAGAEGFWRCEGLARKFRYLCGPWLGSED